jgi:peroxiredoxin
MREDPRSGRVSSGRRKVVLATLAVGYIATCVGGLTLWRRDKGHHVPELTKTRTGQAAPAFRVKTLAGDLFDSATPRRGPILVNFFAIRCGPCVREFARLEPEVWKSYKDRGLSIIAIGTGEKESDLGEFRSKNGLTFPIAADPEQQVAGRFAVPAVPGNYLISIEGRITYQSIGYSEAEFSKLVEAIERGCRSRPHKPTVIGMPVWRVLPPISRSGCLANERLNSFLDSRMG